MADHVGWKPALIAALGKVGETLAVEQVTLTANLDYTLPAGVPANTIHRVVFTQNGTGGHTVTYDDVPLTIDTTAGATTLVEVWPNGDVTYPGATGGAGLDTEAVQDVVGAMVAAAGGSYNDAAGTITLPSGGGGSSTIAADDTPAAPAEGASASYFVTSAVSWPEGLVWSTDPDGGVAPTITGTALVSLFTLGGVTRAIMGATFPALPDTVAPVAGTLASSSITETGFTLTVTGASDAGGLHAQPYCFDSGAGTFGAWQTPATLAVTGKTAGTAYTARHKVRDAAGNETTGASIVVNTVAADTTAPAWTATLTPGTPTETSVVVAASALATDANAITYERTLDSTAGTPVWVAIVPSGLNFTLDSLTAGTAYANCALRAKDAAGNISTPAIAVPSFTTAASADVTPPTVGTMAVSAITSSGFTLTVSGASDETALHATPYAFTTNGGTDWTAYQASAVYVASGLAASTGYSCNWRVRDAAGNVSTGTAQTVTTAVVEDTFTRAATTSGLGVAETGQAWTTISTAPADLVISSNNAKAINGSGIAVVDAGVADCVVSCTVKVVSASSIGVIGRAQDASNHIRARINYSAGSFAILKLVSGTPTVLSSYAFSPVVDQYYEIALSMNGSTLEAYLDGVLRCTATVSEYASNTKHGLVADSVAQHDRLDNFKVISL